MAAPHEPHRMRLPVVEDAFEPVGAAVGERKAGPGDQVLHRPRVDQLAGRLQRAFPAVKVVKTLNTMNALLMVNPQQLADGDHTVFVCGNDAEAKALVTDLLRSLGWRNVLDLGDITAARGAEMVLPIWLRLMGRYRHRCSTSRSSGDRPRSADGWQGLPGHRRHLRHRQGGRDRAGPPRRGPGAGRPTQPGARPRWRSCRRPPATARSGCCWPTWPRRPRSGRPPRSTGLAVASSAKPTIG